MDDNVKKLWQALLMQAISRSNIERDDMRGAADRLRSLIMLNEELKRRCAIAHGTSQSFNEKFTHSYSALVDSMDEMKGLNNYGDMILSLTSGSKNEGQSWKCSLNSKDALAVVKNSASSFTQEEDNFWHHATIKERKDPISLSPGCSDLELDLVCWSPEKPGSVSDLMTCSPRKQYLETNGLDSVSCGAFSNNTRNFYHENNKVTSRNEDSNPGTSVSFVNNTRHTDNQISSRKEVSTLGSNTLFPNTARISNNQSNLAPSIREGQNNSYITGSRKREYCQQEEDIDENNERRSYMNGHGSRFHWKGRNSNNMNKPDFSNRGLTRSGTDYRGCNRSETRDQRDQDNRDDDGASDVFRTAREQFVINQRKSGREVDKDQNQISANSYGTTKRSLGTRRGPAGKFIPPIMKKGGDDDERNSRSSKLINGKGDSGDYNGEVDERLKNIEPKMVELIENEIMDHGPPVQWDDIAGLEFAKATIQEIVVWPMLRPDIFHGLRGPPKGLLLFGPPGTGKTLIGKCIASQSHATFFSISASSLTSKWVGEGEKMVRALFAVARCHSPAVIFIDEIDSLLTHRVDGEHESSRRIKTEFLVQLDGATTKAEERFLVIGATNRPQELDEAARRRLVKRLYIPLPEPHARKQIIVNLMKEQRASLTDENFNAVVEMTDGYSGADMSNLCREAALGPIRSIAAHDIRYITPDEVRPIEHRDFQEALKHVRPSVCDKDLDSYIEWNEKFGSGS